MNIIFRDSKLQKLLTDHKKAIRKWGAVQATRMRQRMDDLRAADTLEEMRLLPGRCHELTTNRAGQLSLDLEHPDRLLFEPADDPPAVRDDGGIDWSRVRSIRILGVVNTHE